jgi:N-acetylmuramoyl-L-alanine amidase
LILREKPSPNFDSRDGQAIDMLVLHYTGMRTADEALQRLVDPAAKVSAHYLIDEDGTVVRLVAEAERAWHAGVSSWRGNANINARSIGIELVNPGHEHGYRAFPQAQMAALQDLAGEIVARHRIAPRNVVGHSDVAPARKTDPGELFDWKRLAAAGIGLWPSRGGKAVGDLPTLLARYGYDVADRGAATSAFQRHFASHRLDGIADEATLTALTALLSEVEGD